MYKPCTGNLLMYVQAINTRIGVISSFWCNIHVDQTRNGVSSRYPSTKKGVENMTSDRLFLMK